MIDKTLERLRNSRWLGEAAGLVTLALALVTLLALASYSGSDPSWFTHRAVDAPVHNWFGRLGALLAETLLQLLGTAAILAPLALGKLGWRLMRPEEGDRGYGRWAGHAALGLFLCSLLDLLYGRIAYGGESFPAGGYLGQRLAGIMKALLATPGALLISATVVAATLVVLTRGSIIEVLAWLARRSASAGAALRGAAAETWANRERWWRRAEDGAQAAAAAPAPSRPTIRVDPSAVVDDDRPAPPTRAPERSRAAESPRPTRRTVEPPAPTQRSLPLEESQRGFTLPPLELLNEPEPQMIESETELLARSQLITTKLREFAVNGSVVAIHPGPVVTTFEFKPEAGVKYSKITSMTDDLSLALKAESVRIDRMPGRATVGIEVPNRRQETIFPRDMFNSEAFRSSRSKLTIALGKDISGAVFTTELDRMPHLLIAGATGSGKSVGLNGMIASILYKATPDEVRFIMIDTKMIELGVYAGIPHLLVPVVTDPKHASAGLKWACREMEGRYRQLAAVGVRNIAQFNALLAEEPERTMEDPRGGEPIPLTPLPYIVIVIDELADLMIVSSSDVEESIMRLAQMARAVGIHLIIATQRPSVDVITGTIKANFPSRVAFRVSQRVDSRTIIDQQGAEHLLGRGDMLFLSSGSSRLRRLHGGLITEGELARITAFVKRNGDPDYDDTVLREAEDEAAGYDGGERDEMYLKAVQTVIQDGKCSITLIQRRLQLGYARAARIVDMMERDGVVSAGEGSKPREVLVGPEYLEEQEAAQRP